MLHSSWLTPIFDNFMISWGVGYDLTVCLSTQLFDIRLKHGFCASPDLTLGAL